MKKIKVMNLIWHMGDGGAQQIVINYLRAFRDDPDIDFRVCVFSSPTNSKYDREIRENHYPVIYLNEPNTKCPVPYVRRFFRRAAITRAWQSAFADFQPDIVHVHLSALLEQALPAITHSNIPVRLYTLHSNPYRQKGRLQKTLCDAFRNRQVIPICLTEEQVQMARDWYGITKYELVRNGMDVQALRRDCCPKQDARAQFGLDPDAFVVIGVGRLSHVKNFPLLIEALGEIRKIRPDAKLVLAGDGEERSSLLRLVQEKKLTDHVIFLGTIPNVVPLYSAADVLGVTSFSEALPLAVLEAQICGLRCVLSDGVPSESILSENTRKMPAGATAQDWAKALLDTQYSGSTALPLELFDVHQVNRQIKEIYVNYFRKTQTPAEADTF